MTAAGAAVVQRCFDRGAERYQQLAWAQAHMGEQLWERCPEQAQAVLDLGSGPGHWTARLAERYPEAKVLGLDLSLAMVRQALGRYPDLPFIQGDARALPLAAETLDLVFSNLALQWCPQTHLWLQQLQRVLKPQGRALINTLLPGSLKEIDQAWQAAGVPSRVLAFPDAAALEAEAFRAGFGQVRLAAHRQVFYYSGSRELLKSVSGIGASGGAGQLKRSHYQAIHRTLEASRRAEGLPLTYELLVMELIK